MSFMFKPLAYDEPNAVNKIQLKDDVRQNFIRGNEIIAKTMITTMQTAMRDDCYVLCMDGYVSAQFGSMVEALQKAAKENQTDLYVYDMWDIYKTQAQIDELTKESLPLNYEDDPVLLFGRLYKGNIENFIDPAKQAEVVQTLKERKKGIHLIYGMGSASEAIRKAANGIAYLDVTPKVAAIRAREEKFVNIGDESARPFNLLMRRNYFVDFEVTLRLRKTLLDEDAITFYILDNDDNDRRMLYNHALNEILDTLIQYPFRAKPVYLEGIWGGEYIRKIRNIPMDIAGNIAWIFEFIPMEVSIEVAVGDDVADIPFYTFVQKKGLEMMGQHCMEEFEGYFPIRFNYDDTWHSDVNMSIQVHPDEDFIIENYDEFGRQDEAYYVIATGHGAKTYVGWKNDGREFLELAKKSEKDHCDIDYQKYVNAVPSIPGKQIMLPAGTIHSSGRNQLILELGSLTIGSYTYKVYDYNRKDKEGKVRPIHTANAEKVLHFERDSEWVDNNIAIEPIMVEETPQYREYTVGSSDLMYYQTNRIEMETHAIYEGKNNGQFTVLTLVDGEEIKVYSKSHPEFSYTQKYLDIVTIPATIEDYVIEAKGYQPVVIHKTFLRENYSRYKNLDYKNR